MNKLLFVVVIVLILFYILPDYLKQRRQRAFSKNFPLLQNLVTDSKYMEALGMLKKVSVFKWRHKLEPDQRREIALLEVECLEKLNKTPEAVVSLAGHLDSTYEIGAWPKDLLSKWIKLYKSCDPIDVEEFYFCSTCGLHPETEALLRHAIEEENCRPPVNFPGKDSGLVVHISKARR